MAKRSLEVRGRRKEYFLTIRFGTLVLPCLLAVLAVTGCAKSSSDGAGTSAGATDASPQSVAVAAKGDPSHGQAIFTANCASCHGAAGAGGGIGPTLKGEKTRKNMAAAVTWIKNPMPPMPKLYPSPLGDKDVADVAAYVESL